MLSLLALVLGLGFVSGREVHVDLNAPWTSRAVDPITEVAEFISQHSSETLWTFVEELCKQSDIIDGALNLTSADGYDAVMEVAVLSGKKALPTQLHELMKASATLGMYAPTVEFYTSLSSSFGEPCGAGEAYALYGSSSTHCELTRASFQATDNQEESSITQTWDYQYPSRSPLNAQGDVKPAWTLHGVPGSSSFCGMHAELVKASNRGELSYRVRPVFPNEVGQSSTRTIQGYGVFLDIKNMEYRNADDSPADAGVSQQEGGSDSGSSEDDTASSFPEGEEVSGLVLSTLLKRRPALTKELTMLKQELLEASEADTGGAEMKLWKMLDLGLQTTKTITSSADPVRSMTDILHNFPRHAASLSSSRVDQQLRDDVNAWYGGVGSAVPPGALYINGLRVDLGGSTFNLFGVMGQILKEAKSMEYLSSKAAGLESSVRKGLLGLAAELSSPSQSSGPPPVTRIDVSKGGKYVINFINNLEKDPQYGRMPKTVKQLLQPSWSLHAVRRNLYTLVAVVDPVSTAGASMITQLQGMYMQQYPIRFGIVLACDGTSFPTPTDAEWDSSSLASSEDVCRIYHHAKKTYGADMASTFLNAVAAHIEEKAEDAFEPSARAASSAISTSSATALNTNFLTRKSAMRLYAETVAQKEGRWTKRDEFAKEAVEAMSSSEPSDFVKNSTLYRSQRGLKVNSYALNGIVQDSYDITNHMMQLLGREQFMLAQMVRRGQLTDKTKSIYAAILKEEKDVYERYHPLLDEDTPHYIDTNVEMFGTLRSQLTFYHNGRGAGEVSNQCTPTDSPLVISGLHNTSFVHFSVSPSGLRSALGVVNWLISADSAKADDDQTCELDSSREVTQLAAFIARPAEGDAEDPFSRDVLSVLSRLTSHSSDYNTQSVLGKVHDGSDIMVLKLALEMFLEGKSAVECVDAIAKAFPSYGDTEGLTQLKTESFRVNLSKSAAAVSRLAVTLLEGGVGVDGTVVVYNSRAVTFLADEPSVHALDLVLLAQVEGKRLGEKLAELLLSSQREGKDGSSSFTGIDFLNLYSFCGRYATSGSSRYNVQGVIESVSGSDGTLPSHVMEIPPLLEESNSEGSSPGGDGLSIVLVVDPLSRAGQRAAAVVQFIQHQLKLSQLVVFTPDLEISDFPLQNFFRFVGGSTSSRTAVFKNLPRQHTLTVRIDSPEAWNVQTHRAVQDIDNLKCDGRSCGDVPGDSRERTFISYRIKSLLVAGQCFEDIETNPTPPNGLQLVMSKMLGNGEVQHFSDTLVMQNLGYWQLQANPGLWSLTLAAGRASALYDITGSSGTIQGNRVIVPVRSFADAINHLYVEKKEGMRHLSLLDADGSQEERQAASSMWSSLSGMFSGKQTAKTADEDDTIHVFSLATGQVYERLLRIMMLSVAKRTSSPVKFWLFEYYLSPAFKQTVDAMCKQYGFSVGYVTYKWPEWLTQQTVKQRIIWGYKILFLDVLFPLDVKKVIYVDADQVVRADLKELWDMDLEGKPYAYTPFCDSREETLGFQFWRQGYWADHLRGRPYHISALYVVDLQVFRQQAIGDRLRAVYDSLAKDPNSLANLDQDLPNYAQHVVPIHSLPQEWLWCETWCSEKSKKKAKTIDLCNNPLHKEPKLDMARRVINGTLFPESWVELDEEIKSVITTAGLDNIVG